MRLQAIAIGEFEDLDRENILEDIKARLKQANKSFSRVLIGGLWSGAIDGKKYDPYKITSNYTKCTECDGTKEDCYYCKGTGKVLKPPEEWKQYSGDIITLKNIDNKHVPYSVLLPNSEWYSLDAWSFSGEEPPSSALKSWSELVKDLLSDNKTLTAVNISMEC